MSTYAAGEPERIWNSWEYLLVSSIGERTSYKFGIVRESKGDMDEELYRK